MVTVVVGAEATALGRLLRWFNFSSSLKATGPASTSDVVEAVRPMVMSVLPEWAAASTRTPSVEGKWKSPLKATVRVAKAPPAPERR